MRSLKAKILRKQAEDILGKGKAGSDSSHYFGGEIKLAHELEIFQIELEMQIEELERLNAEKDKLFSILAHDLRSPFSAFLGLTELLKANIQVMDKDSLKEISISLSNSAKRVYSLIENLLEWARMQRGIIEYNPGTACLLTVIKRNTDLLSEMAAKKEMLIQIQVPDTLYIHADIHMLDLTLRNLLTNAIKFSFRGSSILISAGVSTSNLIEVKITDKGIGMSAQLIERLFHADKNNWRKGTEGEESSGLGLLLCKEFVEKNAGRITVESVERKGSIFSFTIPESKKGYNRNK